MSDKLTKLADLVANRRYRLTADGVEAQFFVITPGPMPLVILSGDQDNASEEIPSQLVQLVGYLKFKGDVIGDPMPGFFSDEPSNGLGYLYYVRETNQGYDFVYLACSPDIKPID